MELVLIGFIGTIVLLVTELVTYTLALFDRASGPTVARAIRRSPGPLPIGTLAPDTAEAYDEAA
jgi:hypothetical protein